MIHKTEALELIATKPYLRAYYGHRDEGALYTLSKADTGDLIPARRQGESEKLLASKKNPRREAERCTAALASIASGDIVIILGLGNPLLLEETALRLFPGQVCIALDSRYEVGRLLFEESTVMQNFLRQPGCHAFCGPELNDSYHAYLDALPLERLHKLRILTHAASRREDPDFYAMATDRLSRSIQTKMSDLLTRFEFEKKWLRNIIINTNRLPPDGGKVSDDSIENISPYSIRRFRNALRGIPGLLVAAGPSLRYSLDIVAALEKRCFILSCDTAYKPLCRRGITAHGVVALDGQKQTAYHFAGENSLDKTILFADLAVHPFVLRRLQPAGIIFSGTARYSMKASGEFERMTTPGLSYAENIFGPIGDIQSGGSVATTAYEILRYLGADPILLIGQDLAYTGRVLHSSGTHHYEKWNARIHRMNSLEGINEAIIRKRQTSLSTGLDGTPALTDYVLDMYRSWFEDALPRTGVRNLNLTAAGVEISGVERPQDLMKFSRSLPEINAIASIFEQAAPPAIFQHASTQKLLRDLELFIGEVSAMSANQMSPKNQYVRIEKFLSDRPFLQAIQRRVATYINRNREKLEESHSEELMSREILDALKELYKAMKYYRLPC